MEIIEANDLRLKKDQRETNFGLDKTIVKERGGKRHV